MICVRVGEKDKVHVQSATVRKTQHFCAIGASIKSCCCTTRGIPDQIRVDRHIVIMRVELRKAVIRSRASFSSASPTSATENASTVSFSIDVMLTLSMPHGTM